MSDNQQQAVVPGGVVDLAAAPAVAMDQVAQIAGQPATQVFPNGPVLKAVVEGAVAGIPVTARPANLQDIFGTDASQVNEFLARQCESSGYTAEAQKLRNRKARGMFMQRVEAVRQHRVTVGDVTTLVVAGAAAWLVYEGLTYYFEWDLPRVFSERPTAPKGKK